MGFPKRKEQRAVYVCMYVCMPGAVRGRKRASDPLGLELSIGVSNHVGAGSRTDVLEEQSLPLISEPSVSHMACVYCLTLVCFRKHVFKILIKVSAYF